MECPAALALIYRELTKLHLIAGQTTKLNQTNIQEYLANNPNGLTKDGITHWTVIRPQLPPQLGGRPLPAVAARLVLDQNLVSRPQPKSPTDNQPPTSTPTNKAPTDKGPINQSLRRHKPTS